MADHIQPKPTRYRKITFNSRLEARWAVLLDHLHLITDWKYEPFELRDKETNHPYTPDFLVQIQQYAWLLEVKPSTVELDYLDKLQRISISLGRVLWLAEGSIYKEILPTIREIHPTGVISEPVNILLFPWFALNRQDVENASMISSGFRFDLMQPNYLPPWKQGSRSDFQRNVRKAHEASKNKGRRKK